MKRGRPRHNNQGRSNQGRKPNPNKALESNGPGVKIRGAASTILEKYLQLANDATTSGDRVSAEYYYQYAEHYGRLVQAQQREREEREEQQRAHREAKQAEYEARKAARQQEQQAQNKPKPEKPNETPTTGNGDDSKNAAKAVPVVSPKAPDPVEEVAAPVRRRVRRPRSKPDAQAES